MADPITLAYLAGIIDGEGCIAIYGYHGKWIASHGKRSVVFRLDVKVGMGEPQAVEMLCATFGGSICTRGKMPIGGIKPSYQWCVSGKLAIACLRQIVSYLHVKRSQAELALEFNDVRLSLGHKYGRNPYTKEELVRLVQYGEKLKEAKRKIIPLYATN